MTKAGETVLVTERDEVIAELRPPRRQPPPATAIDDVLDDLASAGLITRSTQPKERWTWRVPGLGLPQGTTAALLEELREDR